MVLSNVTLSIVIVTYNAEETIEKTLSSIFNQTYKNFEIIIIDGKSNDKTLLNINKYKINTLISEPDNGIYYAMNKGLKIAKGNYITFLNAGDYYCNELVLENVFLGINDEDLIYGDINVNEINNSSRYQKAMDFTLDNLKNFGTAVVCHQAFFIKREIAPLYNIKYKFKAELNWYFDIIEKNKNLYIKYKNIPVVDYSLGGYGYLNYKKNLYEWGKLFIKRYGIINFFKYKIPQKINKKIKERKGVK